MNNQAFSKILFLIILIILAGGGIFTWQYFGILLGEREVPEETIEGNIISLVYTSENWAWGHAFTQIEISGNGDFNYTQKLEGEVKEKFDGKLSEAELKELSKLILSENFFSLPEDLQELVGCADAPTEFLKITMKTSKGEITHAVEGYCVRDESFLKITLKIHELVIVKK